MINHDDYKDEILSLSNKGLSSSKIALEMSGRYGLSFYDRSIRSAIQRWSSQEPNGVTDILDQKNMPPDNWGHAWLKTKEGTVFIKNKSGLISFDELRESLIDDLKSYSPKFDAIKRPEVKEDRYLLVLDIADLHVGKYASSMETGEDYNSDIAVKLAAEGVAGVLDKCRGFPLDKILFVIGNDVLHVDGAHNTTTSGTRQDVDRMWFENYQLAKNLYVHIIESLVPIADVHITHNPSNHDYVTGYMLADSVYSYFRSHPNITFDVSPAHRKYFRYHSNLIGTSHGDGAKMEDMPLLMANEASKEWAKTSFRYIYLHHIHHMKKINFLSGKDYHGATVEYLRSVSFTDSWHHRNGYQHSPKCVTGFIHHKDFGQVSRITHLFK